MISGDIRHARPTPTTTRHRDLADPALSRFDPLPRIICLDDFDRGFCGWTQLVGNYEETLDAMLPGYAQHTSPMLSTLPNWDAGSHNSVDGTYALKIATRPRRGAQNVAIKRLTFREARADPDGVLFHLQARGDRAAAVGDRHALVRLPLRPAGRRPARRWRRARDAASALPQCPRRRACAEVAVQAATVPIIPIGTDNKTVTHYHLAPEDWEDLPGGEQRLCYNEIPTKVNWHYVRFDFDLATMRATGFRCNDREFRRVRLRSDPHSGDEEPLVHAQPCVLRRDRHRQARVPLSRFGLPLGRFLMRTSTSAIVARNETWTGEAATEPYEAGWANEAIIFVRALKAPSGPQGRARVEMSPDGMNWIPEGTEILLPDRKDAVTFARVSHFGTWLRLAATLPENSANTVLVTIHLKS